jgi:hypothetical protein
METILFIDGKTRNTLPTGASSLSAQNQLALELGKIIYIAYYFKYSF